MTGTIVGMICGYRGGYVDTIMMRISDVCLAFPGLVFALAIAALLNGGLVNAVFALAAISWPKYAMFQFTGFPSIRYGLAYG